MSKFTGLIFACLFMCICFRQVYAAGLDPTRPLGSGVSPNVVAVAVEKETIVLNRILISSNRKIAIINGQQLHEGQSIKGIGAQVKKIDADAVVLQQGEKVWQLPLNTTIIRK